MNKIKTPWAVAGLLVSLCFAGAAQAQTSTITRVSSFEYDEAGLLVREVIEPDQPQLCLQTTHTYTAQGNRASSTASACAGASGHTLSSAGAARGDSQSFAAQTVSIDGVSYSTPAGVFATAASNALGQSESREYDPRHGQVTKLTGPNGGVTTWAYDSFGRKTRENRADGTYTVWEYKLCQPPGQGVDALCATPAVSHGGLTHTLEWYVKEVSYGTNNVALAAAKYQFHDSMGRAVRTRSDSFFSSNPAHRYASIQDSVYNALGQLVYQSIPYLVQGGQPHWSSYQYDALGRVSQETTPDGNGATATLQTAYNGLVQTITNALGQTKTIYKNAAGQTDRIVDALGGEVKYTYDALGQLTQTDAAGVITKIGYDTRGRKTGMQDAAMGRWDYAYNAFGELVWQQDSLGQTVTMDYDALGRMTQRSEPDLVSQWYYDKTAANAACGASIGKLCEATAGNDYRRLHTYDGIGRPIGTSNVLDNPAQPAVVSMAYDSVTGRLKEQTWPTGYKAQYEYTAAGSDWTAGHLLRVRGIDGATQTQNAMWQTLDKDPQGRLTKYLSGNNVVTQRSIEAFTGKTNSIQATTNGQSAGNVLNLAYTHDKLGNLLSRSDANTGVAESFSYDALNRLSLATTLGGGLQSTQQTQVLYDAAGNIKYKSDVGYYHYDSQRPSRMTAITLDAAGWSGAIGSVTVGNSGSKALAYAFDDYISTAREVDVTGSTVTTGNGNLMYTVSQDQGPGGAHTVRWEEYTSFNKIKEMRFGSLSNPTDPTNAVADRTVAFVYGPEHQRLRQTVTLTSNAPSHMEAGTTWYMNGADSLGLSYEKQVKDGGALTEHKHYLVAGGESFALHTLREGVIGNKPASQVSYLHHDHLGSLAAVSNESGAIIERLAYDPWGKRRNVDGLADPNDTLTASTSKRGFTMHEHMDEMGVINMNGRVYDPLIGRFLTADPHIQAPEDLQSFNRYSYVKNNPLAYTDPSGYFFKKLKKIFKKAIAVVAIVVAVVVAVYVMPAVLAAMPSVGAALGAVGTKVLTGAVAGGLSSAVAAGSGKAFWKGAASGALFAGAGAVGAANGQYGAMHYAAHAGAGCVSAVASGGKCGQGAASALVGKYVTGISEGIGGEGIAGDIARGAMASVGGGLAAVAGGGKFDEGATTAAFGYLFNQVATDIVEKMYRGNGGHHMVTKEWSKANAWRMTPEAADYASAKTNIGNDVQWGRGSANPHKFDAAHRAYNLDMDRTASGLFKGRDASNPLQVRDIVKLEHAMRAHPYNVQMMDEAYRLRLEGRYKPGHRNFRMRGGNE